MMDLNRTYGVEIEFVGDRYMVLEAVRELGIECHIEGYNHETRNHWKIVSDSSVRANRNQNGSGWELVSPILKGRDGLEQIKKVCKALKIAGAAVNRSCGLHVHHDAADFTTNTFKNLIRLYARFEPVIDSLVSQSRRGNNNRYCKSLAELNIDEIMKQKDLYNITALYGNRYRKLNLQSYITHGTVEFRQHQGTIDADKIINWIKLTQAMVQRAVDRPVRKGTAAADWETFKDYIFRNHAPNNRQTTFSEDTKQLVKFYQKRIKELAA